MFSSAFPWQPVQRREGSSLMWEQWVQLNPPRGGCSGRGQSPFWAAALQRSVTSFDGDPLLVNKYEHRKGLEPACFSRECPSFHARESNEHIGTWDGENKDRSVCRNVAFISSSLFFQIIVFFRKVLFSSFFLSSLLFFLHFFFPSKKP